MAMTENGQVSIDAQKIVELVQQDPTGALLVRNAIQACVIEDQQQMIQGLRQELVKKSQNGAETGEEKVADSTA